MCYNQSAARDGRRYPCRLLISTLTAEIYHKHLSLRILSPLGTVSALSVRPNSSVAVAMGIYSFLNRSSTGGGSDLLLPSYLGFQGAQRRNNCSSIVPQIQCTYLASLLFIPPYFGVGPLLVDQGITAGGMCLTRKTVCPSLEFKKCFIQV
jgi:hypothetical protein